MAPKRILCTEDDPDSLDMIVLLLRNNGFEVRCATNSNEALELAKTEHFDLLLLNAPDVSEKPASSECHGSGLYYGNTRVDPVDNVRHHDLFIKII